jgi:methyl-accepting chemotaxis protein
MRALGNVRVGTRLAAAFGLVGVALLVVAGSGYLGLHTADTRVQGLAKEDVGSLELLVTVGGRLQSNAHLTVRHLYVFDGDLKDENAIAAQISSLQTADRHDLASLRPLLADDAATRKAFASFTAARGSFTAAVDHALAASRAETLRNADDRDGSRDYYTSTVMPRLSHAQSALASLQDAVDSRASRGSATAHSAVTTGLTRMIAVAAAALLLAAALAFAITRSITRPLAVLVERLGALQEGAIADLGTGIAAMAEGDLTVELDPETPTIEHVSRDELGLASASFNQIAERTAATVETYRSMRVKLTELLGRVSASSSTVSAASQQMASTSEEAGRAVGEIANAVSEVASGAERQARMVEVARESTEETGEVAREARAVAGEGVTAAEQADEAMRAVRESTGAITDAIGELAAKSEQIGGIVETITGIAGQTNLLALNAAIEAARAGEQGRGFAVVAEEVRKLAEESQQAAASISELVGEIQGETQRVVEVVHDGSRRTEEGAEVVARAREAFERIGATVDEMGGRIARIAEATSEVAAVAEESSASTEQVSASTQETSASTQEIAASAQELARTAEELSTLVGQFRLS